MIMNGNLDHASLLVGSSKPLDVAVRCAFRIECLDGQVFNQKPSTAEQEIWRLGRFKEVRDEKRR